MEKQAYCELFEIEKEHWWFRGRRAIIFDMISREIPEKVSSALDIGCGTGFNNVLLKEKVEHVTGLEMSDEVIQFTKERAPDITIIKGVFPNVPQHGMFDLITLFDVLEHLDNDAFALKKIHSLLAGGRVIITVPAFSVLWSEHDEMFHHKRRYTVRDLKHKLETAGFDVQRISYFNTLLFLPVLLVRVVKKIFGLRTGASDFSLTSSWGNSVLAFLFGFERYFLRFIDFPFGVSIVAVAKKTKNLTSPIKVI